MAGEQLVVQLMHDSVVAEGGAGRVAHGQQRAQDVVRLLRRTAPRLDDGVDGRKELSFRPQRAMVGGEGQVERQRGDAGSPCPK